MNKIIADANRYRWLRDRSDNVIIDIVSERSWKSVEDYKKQLDNIIDRELSKATPSCLEMAEVITDPQKKEWVGLTEEEMAAAWSESKGDVLQRLKPFARAVEQALKEKNNG